MLSVSAIRPISWSFLLETSGAARNGAIVRQVMGSLIKKRRKRMRKHKHRKMLKRTRAQRQRGR